MMHRNPAEADSVFVVPFLEAQEPTPGSLVGKEVLNVLKNIYLTRSLGALRAPTSSWRPFGPLDFVLRALRALRPCDPRQACSSQILR